MLEELRDDRPFKLGRILDDEGLAIVGPASNRWIARINHVVGFCKKKRKTINVSNWFTREAIHCSLPLSAWTVLETIL